MGQGLETVVEPARSFRFRTLSLYSTRSEPEVENRMSFCKPIFPLLLVASLAAGCGAPGAQLVSVRKIWDRAPHSAFTDLVRFQDRWYCIFREGESHVSSDGTIRVISSADGETWSSSAHFPREPGQDLRDPKLEVTPDGRLMALALDRRDLAEDVLEFYSLVWFSPDGTQWSPPQRVAEPDFLLWRVTWHEGTAYGGGYADHRAAGHRPTQDEFVRLYKSEDGLRFETLVPVLFARGAPNETAIVFRDDGTAVCLLRRDGEENSAQIGTAEPPYTEWNWKDLNVFIGGPDLLVLPDGRLVASGRRHLPGGERRTLLWWVDPEAATATEILELPSAGDTSYAGMVLHQGLLWISYYSTHEDKTSIYLAKVVLPAP